MNLFWRYELATSLKPQEVAVCIGRITYSNHAEYHGPLQTFYGTVDISSFKLERRRRPLEISGGVSGMIGIWIRGTISPTRHGSQIVMTMVPNPLSILISLAYFAIPLGFLIWYLVTFNRDSQELGILCLTAAAWLGISFTSYFLHARESFYLLKQSLS